MIQNILITFFFVNLIILDFILLLCLLIGGNDEWKMKKYRIYEKICGKYVLITNNATKEQADNYKSDNRFRIIKQLDEWCMNDE